MGNRILVIPDKFKGTLSARAAAEAMAKGWGKARPEDIFSFLPMSDGGDGFGEVISAAIGAKERRIKTVKAAHETIEAVWWWEPKKKIAVIEAAKVNGLAMLPPGKFHPFQLDTFGLGKVLLAASKAGARTCLVGIGGSATNDGGFGLARALGWRFCNQAGKDIEAWTNAAQIVEVARPKQTKFFSKLIIAVDVKNPLLGAKGCSRIYGPQKGLRPEDFSAAELALRKLSESVRRICGVDYAKIPGAGAAGGLGFGLMAFSGGRCESGFKIFADYAKLEKLLRKVDLVLTGEGAVDRQTLMGKGVGEVALLCRAKQIPVIALAGMVLEPRKAKRLFSDARGLTDIVTVEEAKREPAKYLETLAAEAGRNWSR